jgi:adenosylhomocysteine nucleosidase
MSDADRSIRVGVLCPMPSELRPVTRRLALRRVPMEDGWSLHSGRVGAVEIAATTTGIGMAAATAAAERLLASMTIDHLLVVGIAGGVDPSAEIGDVIIPQTVVDDATGVEYRPAPFGDADASGRLVSSDDLLVDADAQARLIERGVVAVDMETAAIAAVCEEQNCRWSVFRGISDRARDGLVDDDLLALAGPDGKGDVGALLRYLVRRPWRIGRLARLGRDATLAARRAADAAAAACHEHDARTGH